MGERYARRLSDSAAPTFFPHGSYRRRIRVVAVSDATVEGGLEDDQHYFTVVVHHDGHVVTSIAATSVRAPWSTCPDAARELQSLVGMPLSDRCTAVSDWTVSRMHCTHQLDLTALAIAHAARVVAGGPEQRQYDAEVPFGLLDGAEKTVTLARDGNPQLRWTVQGATVVAPEPFAGAPRGFARWAETALSPDDAEAAVVLKRACSIGMSRGIDLDSYPTLADMPGLSPVCFSMQPQRAPVAFRNRGLIRNYDAHVDDMLAEGP
jgi:hypothetical protein